MPPVTSEAAPRREEDLTRRDFLKLLLLGLLALLNCLVGGCTSSNSSKTDSKQNPASPEQAKPEITGSQLLEENPDLWPHIYGLVANSPRAARVLGPFLEQAAVLDKVLEIRELIFNRNRVIEVQNVNRGKLIIYEHHVVKVLPADDFSVLETAAKRFNAAMNTLGMNNLMLAEVIELEDGHRGIKMPRFQGQELGRRINTLLNQQRRDAAKDFLLDVYRRTIHPLNQKGIYLPDPNLRNFIVLEDGRVVPIDLDSIIAPAYPAEQSRPTLFMQWYQYEQFRAGVKKAKGIELPPFSELELGQPLPPGAKELLNNFKSLDDVVLIKLQPPGRGNMRPALVVPAEEWVSLSSEEKIKRLIELNQQMDELLRAEGVSIGDIHTFRFGEKEMKALITFEARSFKDLIKLKVRWFLEDVIRVLDWVGFMLFMLDVYSTVTYMEGAPMFTPRTFVNALATLGINFETDPLSVFWASRMFNERVLGARDLDELLENEQFWVYADFEDGSLKKTVEGLISFLDDLQKQELLAFLQRRMLFRPGPPVPITLNFDSGLPLMPGYKVDLENLFATGFLVQQSGGEAEPEKHVQVVVFYNTIETGGVKSLKPVLILAREPYAKEWEVVFHSADLQGVGFTADTPNPTRVQCSELGYDNGTGKTTVTLTCTAHPSTP